MQNTVQKENNVVNFTLAKNGVVTNSISTPAISSNDIASKIAQLKAKQVKPFKLEQVLIIKKDGTKEEFKKSKIINSVKNQLQEC